jgi:hypothetical protein
MKSKEKLKDYLETIKSEGEELLAKHRQKIRNYIVSNGCYYSIGIESAILNPEKESLTVTFKVGRKEPLFEDYTDSKEVPLEYLESSDPKLWLDLQRAKEQKAIEDKRKQEFDKKVKDQEYVIAFEQRKLAERLLIMLIDENNKKVTKMTKKQVANCKKLVKEFRTTKVKQSFYSFVIGDRLCAAGLTNKLASGDPYDIETPREFFGFDDMRIGKYEQMSDLNDDAGWTFNDFANEIENCLKKIEVVD